jgi:hypothetical protein
VVDVYTYSCGTNTVEKRRFPSMSAIRQNYRSDGNLTGGASWTGPPQSDPEAMGYVPLSSSQSASKAIATSGTASVGPATSLLLTGCTAGVYEYSLVGNDLTGLQIFPGYRVEIVGGAVAAASVTSSTAAAASGGWRVANNDPARVVFEATARASLDQPLAGFTVRAVSAASPGTVSYSCRGAWIGSMGSVEGPTLRTGAAAWPLYR